MDFNKRNDFVNKFKVIGVNAKLKCPEVGIWGLNDVFSFMGFDYRYFSFKAECDKEGITCNSERNLNSINFEKFFCGLKFNKCDYDFYNSLNNNTLKTVLKKILEV